MTEDEKFFAWLDGELGDAEAAEMEARVAADPKLARLAEQHRALGARLHGAFDIVTDAPAPARLLAEVRKTDAEIVNLGPARQSRDARRNRARLPQWAAIAATLAAGIVVGTVVSPRGGGSVEIEGGKIYAVAAIGKALDTELSSAPSNGDVRIGLTFRDRNGAICRSFTRTGASGLACRDGDRWQVRGLFAAPEGQASDYRMAAGMDPNLAALVDSTMAGAPFGAAEEGTAKQHGWR